MQFLLDKLLYVGVKRIEEVKKIRGRRKRGNGLRKKSEYDYIGIDNRSEKSSIPRKKYYRYETSTLKCGH